MDHPVYHHYPSISEGYLIYYYYAKKLYYKRNYKLALKLFKRAFCRKPNDSCLNYIGYCHMALENYSAAERCYNELIKRRPKWILPYINMARVYWNSEAYEKEYPYLVKAAEINAHNADVLFYLGSYYYAMEEYDKAIEYLNKSIDIDFDQADGHLTLGSAYYKAEMYQQALQEFQIGYKMDSSDINAFYDQALAYIGLKEYDKALDILVKLNEEYPDNIEFMLSLSFFYYDNLHDYENAKKYFDAVLERDPENEIALNHLKMISEKI